MTEEDFVRKLEEDLERKWKIIQAMQIYGGSFAKQLAVLWMKADLFNKRRIEECFSDYFEEYEKFVELNENQQSSRIVSTQGICGGSARIKGTRIRVADIISSQKAGYTVEEIAKWYSISVEDVKAAIKYYEEHKAEIDAILEEEERVAKERGG